MVNPNWPYKYFTKDEVECKCGCGMLPSNKLMAKLDILRTKYGKPIRISSGARCAVYNAKVGGAGRSKHIDGLAVDIISNSTEQYKLAKLALEMGFGGVGVAKTFLHLDIRPIEEGRLWTY